LALMFPLIMGVLNATPDSFSDGGQHASPDAAAARVRDMLVDGADVIDVGGESTRPGAAPVSVGVELSRVIPVIERIIGDVRTAGRRVSVDTRSPEVARSAVAAGAELLNDVSGDLGPLAAELGVGWICTHMAGQPRDFSTPGNFDHVVETVRVFLVERAQSALTAGAPEVWIDPGIGFGKGHDDNLALLAHLDVLVATGLPVAVGTSRKSTMGRLTTESDARVGLRHASELVSTDDRLEASLATATWAMWRGAAMIRTHDVRAHVHARSVVCGQIPTIETQAA